jgi:hypothetical protein
MLLAQMLMLDRPSVGGYSAATVFEPGALLDTFPTGTSFIEALFPAPTRIAGYGGIFLGASANYADGANVQTGNGPLASISLHTVDLQGTADPQTFTHLSTAASIPYYSYGRDHLGRTLRSLWSPTSDGVSALLDMDLPELQMTFMKMICTPDEYIGRNGDGLRSLFRRLHNFSGDQLQYHLRKGFRARFFDRMNNTDLRIIGELSHLGASLREGTPVRNCHADVYRPPSVSTTSVSVTFAVGGDSTDSVTVNRTGTFTGNAFAAEAVQVPGTNIDEDTLSFINEEVVNNQFPSADGNTVTISSDMVDNITNFAHLSDRINPTVDGAVVGLMAHNASQSPFFVQLDDYVLGDNRIAFSCIPQLAEHLSPGIFDAKDGEAMSRDYMWTDFKRGLEFVFDNCSADQASAWSTQMRWVRENFTDFKKGVMPDIYSTEARLDMDTLRHGWNLGLNNLTGSSPSNGGYGSPIVDVNIGSGVAQNVARATAGIQDLYDGGFINTNAVETFVKNIEDLSKRDFLVGSDFTKGLQLVGDAKYTTYHRTTSDGIEHNVDITVQPVAFGHWANIPMTWSNGEGDWSMRVATSGPYTRAIAANVFSGTAEFELISFLTLPEPVVDALSLQETGNNINLGMLCYVFTDAMDYQTDANGSFDGYTAIRELRWSDMTPLCHMPIPEFAGRTAAEATANVHWGNDALGLYRQTSDMAFNAVDAALSGGSLMYFFRDETTVELSPISLTAGWYSRFDRLAKDITAAKSYSPFGNDGININVEGANLVALASFSTGEPSLQQMGDAIFTLAFCGINSGWSIEQRSIDRRLHDIALHQWSHQTGFDQTDYAMMMVPTEMDPSKMLTAFAATNLVCYNLGLVGAGQLHRPHESRSYHLDFGALRTIYRSEAAFNGEIIEHSITLWEEGFSFYDEEPNDPATAVLNQLQAQPGARRYRRLFGHLDPAAAHGLANSLCSMFGLAPAPAANLTMVQGLLGYSDEVNDLTIDVLHNQGTTQQVALGIAQFEDDGSTTPNMYGYWATTDGTGSLLGHNIRNGNFPNVDFVRVMVERQRGIDNLYFKEAQIKLMLFDQDLFDHYTAVRSTMLYEYNRSMLIGPCPHLLIFNHEGQVLLDAKEIAVTAVGAGQSAVTSSAAPSQPSSNESASTGAGDDRSDRPGDDTYDDDN